MATGEVDEARTRDERGELRVVGLGPVVGDDRDGFDAEPGGLLAAERDPAV